MKLGRTFVALATAVVVALISAGEAGQPGPAHAQAASDRDALVAFYNATGGPNWTNNTNWLSGKPLDTWHGVTTDSAGHVTELDLRSMELDGRIPAEIGNLSNLHFLDFGRNQLSGAVPAELGNLSNLRELYLGGNRLTGAIPAELGNLSNLDRLFLWPNQLSGTIPAELGNLSNLRFLNLGRNRLTGTIPAELGNLSNLRYLYLGGNQLSGTIPAELGNLSNLEQLYLHENELAGAMPTELEGLSRLSTFRLWGNQWTGCIPARLRDTRKNDLENILLPFCDAKERNALVALYNSTDGPNWTNSTNWLTDKPLGQWHGVTTDARGHVTHLELDDNRLTGQIPSALGNLDSLLELSLSGNKLMGRIPSSLGRLDDLLTLRLAGNRLSGCIPGELQGVRESDLGELGLPFCGVIDCVSGGAVSNATNSGLVSDCEALLDARDTLAGSATLNWSWYTPIAQWDGVTLSGTPKRVHKLYLQDKGLTGTIPPELGELSMLGSLDLARNELSGEIPAEIGSLVNLRELALWDNDLRGEIPPRLGSLSKLEHLNMSDNPLYGEIPEAFANLRNLRSLSFWNNNLSGEIPSWFGRLSKLYWLSLAHNELTGTIPAELGNLSNLTYLYLLGNQLTGEIPTELGNLTRLDRLGLQNNPGLRGALPRELTRITTLRSLRFHYTGLCVPPDDSFQAWLFDIQDWKGSICPSESPAPTTGGDGVIVRDVFGRVVNETGIVLVDWEGHIANPTMKYFIEIPAGTRFPTRAVLSSGESRMYFDRDSSIGENGPTKVLELADSSSDGEFLISIFPDRDTSDEKHSLTIRYRDGSGRIRSQMIDVHVMDQDQDRPLEFNVIANFSYDDSRMFDDPAVRKTVQQVADDWSYFIGDMDLDEVPAGEELIRIWDPGSYVSGKTVTNDIAYTGYMMYVYGHPIGELGTGGPSWGGRKQTSGGVEYPIRRSGTHVLEPWTGPRMSGWTVSIPESEWWKSHVRGYVTNDLYSGVLHEAMGHMMVFNDDIYGFAWFSSEDRELRIPSVMTYSGSYPVINRYGHLPGTIDPASKRGAFGNEYAGEAPNGLGFRLVTKLDLLIAEAVGYVLRDTSPFRQLSIPDEPPADAVLGAAYSHTMNGGGGIPAYDWTIESGALPDGLSLDRFTGAISGTPTKSGAFSFILRLRDNTEGHPGVTRAATLNVGSRWTCPDDTDNPGLVADCEALLESRGTLAGSAALNWSADVPIRRWDGVHVAGSPGRVTKVKLQKRGLSGRIPAALGRLEALEELWLYTNKLTGTIPAELGNLGNLRWLFVADNDLGGQIPEALNSLTLDRLWLQKNDFTGCVPYNLTLTREYKADRGLPACAPPGSATPTPIATPTPAPTTTPTPTPSGSATPTPTPTPTATPVPTPSPTPTATPTPSPDAPRIDCGSAVADTSNLGLVADCEYLLGMKDELRGSAALNWSADVAIKRWNGVALGGSPERVTKVKLQKRELNGQIPAALGRLDALEELWLYTNKLTGTIPAELGNLGNLRWLFVADNDLGGQIPETLNRLSLDRLWLQKNDFTGCVPYNLTLTREYKADRGLPACTPPTGSPTPTPTPTPTPKGR